MATTRHTTAAEIGVGDVAPDFTLPDQNGHLVTLSQFRGKKNVVLFFYPAAFSAGCTAEACAFRDSHEVFKEAGAEVIGISMDKVEKQNSFAKRFNLTYTLLADDGSVWKSFGVPNRLGGLIRGRVTYVIDKRGVVQHAFNSQVMVLKHVQQALETLKALE
jgi:peroxiredoxin Q/BCP